MKHLFKFSMLLIILSVFVGCNKDDDSSNDDDEEDIEQLVENFATPELIASLTDLGFDFNDGQDTPDISGTFTFSNVILVSSNVENDAPAGTRFNDNTVQFSNLNPEERTFTFSITENGTSQGETEATFYSGVGDQFSAYVRTSINIEGIAPVLLYSISGTITEEGITNAQLSLLMLDDKGDPQETLIDNGEGRLFKDEDGTATRQD